jgi:hypothetical protein
MTACDIAFTLDAKSGRTPLTLSISQAVIAGWTGRDPVARDKHIAELEAIGIARPASTPIYYRGAASRLTTAGSIDPVLKRSIRHGYDVVTLPVLG